LTLSLPKIIGTQGQRITINWLLNRSG
jgi:hypothetical protein